MIFAYDCQGITMTDRVPCGRNITGVYIMHKNRPQLLVDGPLILHDNARLHITDDVAIKLHDYQWEELPHVP